jgi:hypothetical protein
MFRIFRHLRKAVLDSSSRFSYFKYAFGEVLLVVIGILIALQVNNWNEERIEHKQIREYVLSLVGDIERDMEMLDPVARQINNQIERSRLLAEYLQGRSIDEVNNIDLYMYFRFASYRPFAWNRASLEQLKNSGALRQIRNPQLVQKISEYDALTRHLDQDYAEDGVRGMQASEAARKLFNRNYPNRAEIDELLRTGVSPTVELSAADTITAFRESETYRNIRADDLAPLTDDIREIQRAVNAFIEYGDLLGARTEIEFPRLEGFGSEIIELVRSEYPADG